MSFPQFQIKIEGVARFTRAVDGLQSDFEDHQETLEFVAERGFYPSMQEFFDTEGYGHLKPLTARYAARKRARYGDQPILQASGAYMRSLTRKGAAGNVHLSVGRDTLIIGSNLRYSRYVNDARPLELTDENVKRMGDLAEESMRERIEKRGVETN
jgi:hypothetical protein